MNRFASERASERERLLNLAVQYADAVRRKYGPATILLYGSVARGDFNSWSDVDVLVVSDRLPAHPLERSKTLQDLAYPGIEPKGYSLSEYREARRRDLPFMRDLAAYCVVLGDDLGVAEGLARPQESR